MANDCFNELSIEGLKKDEVEELSKLINSDSLLEKLLSVQDNGDAYAHWGTIEISGGLVEDETDDYLSCQFNTSKYSPSDIIVETSKLYPAAIFKLTYEVGECLGAMICQDAKTAAIEYDISSEVEQLMNDDESLDEEDAQDELRDRLKDKVEKEWEELRKNS